MQASKIAIPFKSSIQNFNFNYFIPDDTEAAVAEELATVAVLVSLK
jgi:hypothetical protein